MNTSKIDAFVKASQTITAALQAMFLTEETGDGSSGISFYNLDTELGRAEIQIRDGELLFFHIITPEGQVQEQKRHDAIANWPEK